MAKDMKVKDYVAQMQDRNVYPLRVRKAPCRAEKQKK